MVHEYLDISMCHILLIFQILFIFHILLILPTTLESLFTTHVELILESVYSKGKESVMLSVGHIGIMLTITNMSKKLLNLHKIWKSDAQLYLVRTSLHTCMILNPNTS